MKQKGFTRAIRVPMKDGIGFRISGQLSTEQEEEVEREVARSRKKGIRPLILGFSKKDVKSLKLR